MAESEVNLSSVSSKMTPSSEKAKPKKRSLVERELETSLTAQVTSPAHCGEGASTSRYGRARRVKTDNDFCSTEKAVTIALKSPKFDKTPIKSPTAYKMHASNSPVRVESVLQNQIENICSANIALSRFGSDEKPGKSPSPAAKKFSKTYVKTDLVQTKEKEETVTLIKNMFSPNNSGYKPNRRLSNLERSSEKCVLKGSMLKQQNGYAEKASIVKTLDFDSKQKSKNTDVSIVKTLNFDSKSRRKDREPSMILSKSELFDLEAKCEYQVGDLAWARMGTYPFWPCIVTREPDTNMFVRKKLFGRIERNIINVTFFGDNGRRSWIVDTMLRKFQGLKEFEATREQFKPEDKKKDPRLYAAFFISDKKQSLWLKSVEEAETFMKEPKRLRIDLLYDLLEKLKIKQNQKSQKKLSRADSDVSLSESLLDTLFSEDDSKSDDPDRGRKKRMSLDVSEVVTACLDNMAARTGLTQIQKQSHMDRWLQKAKSKTPEKSQLEITITVEKVDEAKEREKTKANEKSKEKTKTDEDKNKNKIGSNIVSQKPYSLRKSTGESHLLPTHNEHDYSAKFNVDNCYVKLENIPLNTVVKLTPPSDSTETIGKVNKNENNSHSLTNAVDDQTETEVLNAIETEEVLETKNNVTDNGNVSSLETNVEFNNSKLTQKIVDITSEKVGDENEQKNSTNGVVNDQIALEYKIVTQEQKVPKNDEISDENGSCSEMDVNRSFNEEECSQGADVDKYNKNTVSTQLVRDTIPIEYGIEIAAMKSNQEGNNSEKNIARNDIHSEANDIPVISVNQTEPIIKESIYDYSPIEKKDSKDLTKNDDQQMSCDDASIDCSTDIPSVNNEPVINVIIQEDDNEKESVDSKSNRNEMDPEKNTESIQVETFKIDENITITDSVRSLSSDVEQSNDIKCSTGEVILKREDVAEKDIQCDADFCMLSEKSVAEKHKNESEDETEVILQDMNESLSNNNDEETLKIKDTVEYEIKNDKIEPYMNKKSESYVNSDFTPVSMTEIRKCKLIHNFASKSMKNNLNSEIKNNYMEYKTNSKDSKSKIKENTDYDRKNENLKNELTQKDLKCDIKNNYTDSEKQMTKSAKKDPSSASLESCSVVVVPLNGPTLNGYYENKLKDIKEDGNTDSDTASTNSELDDLSLIELKKRTIAKTRARRNLILNKQKSYENLVEMREINSQSPLPKIVQMSTGEIKINGNTEADVEKDEIVATKRVLRPRNDTPVESLNPSKESSPDRKIKEEIDSETASVTSEGSNVSTKRRGRAKDKASEEDKMKDPEFIRYVELRQDTLIDEHPELSYDEIVAYLYKTWLYEQSCKSDFVKSHDKEQSNLVKGINPDALQVKTKKRSKQEKNKLINIDKVFKKELIEEFASIPAKDKPKRKTAQPCYAEDYSDIEDEIKMFEIFNNQKEKPKTPDIIQQKDVPSSSGIKEETVEQKEELSPEEYYDEVEAYFEDLTKPKPNIFKGLVREKVCEICEKTSNLVKCKGCNGMFHIDCVKKEVDIVDVPVSTRVRKKKKKPRGRRPKLSTDSNGLDESHSDEKSQDASVSEENKSVEEILNESHTVVADVDNFEAQVAAKMKEMIEIDDKIDYDSYSSDDCLDWRDTIAGKCEIVDVKLKPKKPEIDNNNFKCNNCQKDDVPLCFVCKSPVSPKSQINHRQKCQVAHCHKFYHLECLEYWPQTQFNTVDSSRNKGNVNEHSEALTCPRHVCHTCVCDDPRGCKTRFSGDKLARCVRCPATYHSFTKCLPAGSQILTASHIICPRHYEHRPGKVPCHVNTGWCFICALGGTLICCEYCPTSFHAECLQIDPPDGGYMCEDCETGRLPLYGEMVWVKLGHYRWWPGIVLHPHQIPANIMAVRHSPGEFVVRFFGQYDHYWVNRGRVFPYQEGDSGRISSQKSKIDEAFTIAMEHAQRAFEILKTLEEEEESADIASSLLPPHYVKLKTNKPYGGVGFAGRRELEESSLTQCDCDPAEEHPCGPASHCLNRMLLTECGPSCRAGDRCNNRAFERREYPRLTAYRTKHRGWGLKTLEDVKAGQFVIEYVGELIDEEEFRRRMRRKHEIRDENFYFLTLDKERMIDAGPKGNLARFMNHCCEPNCETQKWTVLGDIRVGLFALKDIPANSELTFNYNLECAGIEKKRCMCGAKRCSGYIGAKPKQEEKESQKKPKVSATKRPYKKRKPEDIANEKNKPKRPVGRPPKPRELTEIEKDLLIIKNATNGISSDSECSGRLSSVDAERERKDMKALKRKRVSFSSEEVDTKRVKYDEDKTSSEID